MKATSFLWIAAGLFFSSGLGACGPVDSDSAGGGGSGGEASGSGSGGAATGGAPMVDAGHGSGGLSGGAGGAIVTGSGGGGVVPPSSSGCPLFTPDDLWNKDVLASAVDAAWTTKLQASVGAVKIHPDFGAGFGIPINIVPDNAAPVPVTFDAYASESDPGPYPFPAVSAVHLEGTTNPSTCDGDCHLLTVQKGTCMLYEGYACHYASGWHCDNGAKWDLKKNSYGQRKSGWTSADAAGLPIYAGLARYEEVKAGAINHALRFTVKCTRGSFVMPATHEAVPSGCSATDPNSPPMGLRVRLKANYDDSKLRGSAKVFAQAFKKYGMILADNGSNFFFQSEDSPNWGDEINDLKTIPASAFEVVAP